MTHTVIRALKPAIPMPSQSPHLVPPEDQHSGAELHQSDDQPEPAPSGEIDPVQHFVAWPAGVSWSASAPIPLSVL
jgi:hypothetical protein